MNIIPTVLSALGLSTAAGLNAYVPLLAVGLLDRYTDLLNLRAPYDVLSHAGVLITLAALAVLDFVGDKVPTVDHALHAAGVVIHPVAGAILCLAANSETGSVNPVLAAVCGLLVAGGTHGVRAAARPVATATTAGVANPLVSLIEDAISLVLSVLAVVVPLVAAVALLVLAVAACLLLRRLWRRRSKLQAPSPT